MFQLKINLWGLMVYSLHTGKLQLHCYLDSLVISSYFCRRNQFQINITSRFLELLSKKTGSLQTDNNFFMMTFLQCF